MSTASYENFSTVPYYKRHDRQMLVVHWIGLVAEPKGASPVSMRAVRIRPAAS